MAELHSIRTQFLALPNELLLSIAEFLNKESDISAMALANRRLDQLLTIHLYRFNVLNSGSTALAWATRRGFQPPALLSLNAGADINMPILEFPKNSLNAFFPRYSRSHRSVNGLTPLQAAICQGHSSFADFLIEKGADIGVPFPESMSCCTMLHKAALMGLTPIVKSLIRMGVDLNKQEKQLRTPLHYAIQDMPGRDWFEKGRTVMWLLERGADAHAKDSDGKEASSLGKKSLNPFVRLMFKKGPRVVSYEAQFLDADLLELQSLQKIKEDERAREMEAEKRQLAAAKAARMGEQYEEARASRMRKFSAPNPEPATEKAHKRQKPPLKMVAGQKGTTAKSGAAATVTNEKQEIPLMEDSLREKQDLIRKNWTIMRELADHRDEPLRRDVIVQPVCRHSWWKSKKSGPCQSCRRMLKRGPYQCPDCEAMLCQKCYSGK